MKEKRTIMKKSKQLVSKCLGSERVNQMSD
jgi:hypothetical protein